MHRLLHLNLRNLEDRNAWYLILEIFWASMLASATTFNAAFALRLEASNTQIGFLTSLPSLVAILVSIPAGNFIHRRAQAKPWLLWSLAIYRSGYLLIALLPWLPIPRQTLGEMVIWILIGFTSLAHFFNVGFLPMLTEVIQEENRASVFAARYIFYNISMSVCGFLFGIWLEKVSFPINYQSMYILGFLTSMLSVYFLVKIQVPPKSPLTKVEPARTISFREQWRTIRQDLSKNPGFARITMNTLMHGLGLWIAAPLYVLYYVRVRGADEAWLGLNGTIMTSFTILGFAIWRWIMARWGEPKTLKWTILWIGVYPLVVGLLPSLTPVLFMSALNGLLSPGVTLSHTNTLMKVTPPENRPGYTAAYMTITSIGAFICPLIGVAVANLIGIAPTLVTCGIICILGSSSFTWHPVHQKVKELGEEEEYALS